MRNEGTKVPVTIGTAALLGALAGDPSALDEFL
jgi:hypothetical protein